MDAATTIPTPHEQSRPRRSPWRTFFKIFGVLFLLLLAAAGGAAYYLNGKFMGPQGPGIFDTFHTVMDPATQFPGQDRITVLCLGLDRNVYANKKDRAHTGMFFTKGARSDVMMIASLDLKTHKVSILSVPRDTRVILPGRRSYSKINDAHARGGIPYTREAVEQFLGTKLDYHVVIKQEAIMEVVDALGGLDLNVDGALIDGVRTDMDYDDNWGQLHIHLKPGMQHLTGQQVVGYMRFRHDAEGDLGRIRRQQQVIQVLSEKVKSPTVLAKADGLIKAIHEFVQTDLTAKQQLALAVLFHKINTANVQTASLPVADTPTIDGVSYVVADDERKEAMVDWLINGNVEAMNRLIRVELKNASGDPELYQRVYRYLRHSGFAVWRAGRAAGAPISVSRVVQRTALKGSGRHVLETLGLSGNVEKLEETGADVTFYVGKDLESSQMMAFAGDWEDLPDIVPSSPRRERSRGRRRSVSTLQPVNVQVQSVEPNRDEAAPEDAPVHMPGTADSVGGTDGAGKPSPTPTPSQAPSDAPAQPAVPSGPDGAPSSE